jgi:hypothetical protein
MWRPKAYWPFMVRGNLDLTGFDRHSQVIKEGIERIGRQLLPSYRTRRRRDPWFDKPFDRLTVLSEFEGLTTLSEVEGVSRRILVLSGFRISAYGGFWNDTLAHCLQEYSFSSICYSLAISNPASYLVFYRL